MPLTLTLKHRATLKHINTRKEGDDDHRDLALDLKLAAEGLTASTLATLFPSDAGHDPVSAFWDDDGHPKWYTLSELAIEAKLIGHKVTLGGRDYLGATIKGLSFLIRDERKVDLTFTVQINPAAADVAVFANALYERIDIAIEPRQQELDLAPTDKDDGTTVTIIGGGKSVTTTAAGIRRAARRLKAAAPAAPEVGDDWSGPAGADTGGA